MKLLPLILSLLLASGAEGQVTKDTLPHSLAIGHYGFLGESLPDKDTLKVIFLVTDHAISSGEKTIESPIAYAMKGFITRHKVSDQFNESFWMVTDLTVDDKWKPLDKNIIVWQSRPQ